MAVTYGFFNSVNGDRKYNADQMSEYFKGIVSQGVFQHLDSGMAVSAGTGLSVSVAAGRAIIQNRWVQNSAALNLTISAASETYGRKDAVVIRLDKSSRAISIAVKTGTPAASPVAPSMTRNDTTYEMALAYVNVAAGASSVTVTDKRSDSSVCGWAAVAQATSGEVDQMLNDMKTGFDGVTYPSPAAMVRGCDSAFKNIDGEGKALFWVNGLIDDDGQEQTGTDTADKRKNLLSSMIHFIPGDIIKTKNTNFSRCYLNYYNSDGTWQSQKAFPAQTIIVPEESFIRLSFRNDDNDDLTPSLDFDGITFERNDTTGFVFANENRIESNNITWENGYIENGVPVTGSDTANKRRNLLSSMIHFLPGDYFTINAQNYSASYLNYYTSNGTFIETVKAPARVIHITKECYMRIAYKVNNDTYLVPKDGYTGITFNFTSIQSKMIFDSAVKETSIISKIGKQLAKNRAYKSEDYRPQFHPTPEVNAMNDPHGFIYYKGKYHLYYQHGDNVRTFASDNAKWGHFVSDDLFSWQEHGIAMALENGGCWDGTCLVDSADMLGFGENAMLAFYTARISGKQHLYLAYSTDEGETFSQYENNPIISWEQSGQSSVFRDPKIIYDSVHSKYVMTIAGDSGVLFYSSTDLLNWIYLSTFSIADGVTECPRFFKIENDYVLITSFNWDNQNYYIGTWDGITFTSSYAGQLGNGSIYALETSSNTEEIYGIHWYIQSNNRYYMGDIIGNPDAVPFNGMLSTVYRITVDNNKVCLNPVLPDNKNVLNIDNSGKLIDHVIIGYGDSLQIKLEAEVTNIDATSFGFVFNKDESGFDEIIFDGSQGRLRLYRKDEYYYTESTVSNTVTASFNKTGIQNIDLNLIIDRRSVDAYMFGGSCCLFAQTYNKAGNKEINFSTYGSGFRITHFEVNGISTAIPNKF